MTCQSGAITPKVGGVLTPQIYNYNYYNFIMRRIVILFCVFAASKVEY